jgi:hypothetical protein
VGEDEQPLHQVRDSERPPVGEAHEEGVLAATEGEQVRVRFGFFLSLLRQKRVVATRLVPKELFADLLPFPSAYSYFPSFRRDSKPITAYLYFHGTDLELASHHQLVMDLPGGGFICMSPEHHAERLLRWAKQTGLPILSFDYGKVRRWLPRGVFRTANLVARETSFHEEG